MRIGGGVIISFGLSLVWLLLLSGLRWWQRLLYFVGVIGVIAVLANLVRIRGVSGDLVPIFEWRWQKVQTVALPSENSAATPSTNAIASTLTNSYPQFLGPNRDGTIRGVSLARDWNTTKPQELWRQPIGAAWSGFAIFGNYAVTQEQRDQEELVVCYDLLTGKPIWSHTDTERYFTVVAGEGPRATPTIASNRVFTVGATGLLNCLDLATGKKLWSHHFIKENNTKPGEWGVTGSPLVAGDLVIVNPGGQGSSLVAYKVADGSVAWSAGDDGASYSAPTLLKFGGVEQIVIFNGSAVFAHQPSDGKILWSQRWYGPYPKVTVPIQLPDDRLLVSSGYGVGAELWEIRNEGEWKVKVLWKTNRMKSKFANLFYRDGYIYGLDDGIMACLDAKDGSLKWKEGRFGHGQMIMVEDVFLLMAEAGEIVLLEPAPEAQRVLARHPVFTDKTWNPIALAGEYLLVRNDKEAVCLKLPLATPEKIKTARVD